MAIIPEDLYSGQSTAADADYPYGSSRNVVVSGDGTGWPFTRDYTRDIMGLQQALLVAAGITPTGDPDTAIASQYFNALEALFSTDVQFFTSTTSWTKPAGAKAVTVTLVGWGGQGGNGGNGGGGGGGGGSGQIVQRTLRAADVPSTLDVTISAGVCRLDNGSWLLRAVTGLPGEDGGTPDGGVGGGPSDDGLFSSSLGGAGGGTAGIAFAQMLAGGGGGSDDGAGAGGDGGGTMPGAGGAAAGATFDGLGGAPGLGYGAGGGGGGGDSNPNGGGSGGGGASGWGPATALGTAGADGPTNTGGTGATGCILIVTHRGVA